MTGRFDVLIVGGGPAGSSLAWALRGSGLRIGILDKKDFPRDKICAGWITPAIVESLQIDTEDYRRRHTFQPIHGFRVGRMQAAAVEVHYEQEPVSYGIRRCEFDEYLLRRCQAELMLGQPVKSIDRDNGDWLVNDRYRAPLLVGAGGNFCPVARHLGVRIGKSELAVRAQEVEFEMEPGQVDQCRVAEAIPELYFCDDLQGYGWVFRKQNYLNIGLGREDDHGLPQHIQEFSRFLKRQGRIPADIPDKFNGHAYLLYDHAQRPLTADGALLIGDAAGLAYTRSGEGIRPAIESGLLAAGVIRGCEGVYSATALQSYAQQISRRFGRRPSGPPSAGILPAPVKQWLAHRLLARDWFVRDVVIGKWFLHQGVPALQSR